MTREEALQILDTIPTIGEQVDALEMAIQALSQEPSREFEDYENEIEDLHNRLDIAEYDKERLREEVTNLEAKIQALSQEPCDEVVSRQAVINLIRGCNSALEEPRIFDCHNAGVKFEQYVTELPSVTQKSGKWIEDAKTYYEELNKRGLGVDEYTPYFTDDIACSECLAKYNTIDNETEFFKYCPNCGAKM